eukprot:1160154-Pelagomonas_calceolata.AAC.3
MAHCTAKSTTSLEEGKESTKRGESKRCTSGLRIELEARETRSEGSVASDAEKLAKPVLSNTQVGLICSAWGNRTSLQQTMPCSRMHACIAECAPCKLLLPFIAHFRLSSYDQQQTTHKRISHPHTRAGGAGPAPHRISRLPCIHLSIHAATHTIIRT